MKTSQNSHRITRPPLRDLANNLNQLAAQMGVGGKFFISYNATTAESTIYYEDDGCLVKYAFQCPPEDLVCQQIVLMMQEY